jgi:hypothetical protein
MVVEKAEHLTLEFKYEDTPEDQSQRETKEKDLAQ